jgi:hypothetical protein
MALVVYSSCTSNASSIPTAFKGTAVHPLDQSQGLSRSAFCNIYIRKLILLEKGSVLFLFFERVRFRFFIV